MSSDDRVLIAGAGPVGLVAATYLAREGIPVTVYEADRDLPKDLRASTFHPPTLDMLDGFGVTRRCIEEGLVCPQWQFRDRHDGAVATFDLSLLKDETGHPYRVQCEQWRLTRFLHEGLRDLPEAEVRFEHEVVGATQTEDRVSVELNTPDGTETVHGRYLIGADGARSNVRRSVDVNFEGMTIPELFLTLSTTFEFADAIDDLSDIAYFSDPAEWFVLLRTREFWRVLFPAAPDTTEDELRDGSGVEARLQSVVARDTPYDVVHTTLYRVHERVADKYVHGRILLAGDAAHLNNPLGGMGMNGGIHDAMNLAEKLHAVWEGADPALLGRYERQRRMVAIETVQAQALRNRAILNETDPAKRQDFYDDLRRTTEDPERHFAYVLRSSMLESLRRAAAVE